MLNQALYPVETLEWFVYALYISNRERINKHCLVDSKFSKLIWQLVLMVTCGPLVH